MRYAITTTAIAAILLSSVTAMAADPAVKCEASKNKTAGAYYSCREKAEASAIKKGGMPDYSKCTARFDDKWGSAESSGADMCPDNVLTAPMNAYIAAQATAAAAIIAGTVNVPTCGDGLINAVGEHCDGMALGGADCASLAHDIGTLACDGSCKFDASGCEQCPAGTVASGGSCWLIAAAAGGPDVGSCDTACASVGATCNEAALATVGSNGTDAACQNLLDIVDPGGAPHPISSFSPDDYTFCGAGSDYALGCVRLSGYITGNGADRIGVSGSPTRCSADDDGGSCSPGETIQRVCACTP